MHLSDLTDETVAALLAEHRNAVVLRLSTRYGWPAEEIAADLDAYTAAGCTVAEAAARIQEAGEACAR